jgi:hypothetical protein
MFKAAPKPINLQLESQPPGADAKTSLGPGCRTPCAVPITTSADFTVTFTLAGHQPQTIPVQVIEDAHSEPNPKLAPNPAYAEFEPFTGSVKPKPKKKPHIAARPATAVAASPTEDQVSSAALQPPSPATPFPPPPR